MNSEPTQTQPNPTGNGRPEISDMQYHTWLDDMRPFLRSGHTLHYAMDKSHLLNHKDAIYEKYRSKGWFSERIDALQATIGEMANSLTFQLIERLHTRIVTSDNTYAPTREELSLLKFVATKHRSCQPFFSNRYETVENEFPYLDQIKNHVATVPKIEYIVPQEKEVETLPN